MGVVNESVASLLNLGEHMEHPFGKGSLTTDGVQYGAETTIATTVFTEVPAQAQIKLPPNQRVVEVEFGLTGGVYNASTATTGRYKWQASDAASAWEDLIAAQTTAVTVTTDFTVSGRFAPTGNFLGTGSSFYVRMVAAESTGAGNVFAKAKNSSYVKVITKSW